MPSLIVFVEWISVARNSRLLVMFSALSVEVLADEGVVEAELVGEDDRLAVLAQRLGRVAVQRHAPAS